MRVKDVDFKVFSTPANTKDGRVAAIRVPKGGELSRGDIDELHGIRAHLRREGSRVDQGQRSREGPRRSAKPDRQEPARRGGQGDHRAHRRARRRHHLLRSGSREGGERQSGRAASEDRPFGIRQGQRSGRVRLEAAVGGRLPDVRVRRGRRTATSPRIIRSRARRTSTSSIWKPIRRAASRRPTTWC